MVRLDVAISSQRRPQKPTVVLTHDPHVDVGDDHLDVGYRQEAAGPGLRVLWSQNRQGMRFVAGSQLREVGLFMGLECHASARDIPICGVAGRKLLYQISVQ